MANNIIIIIIIIVMWGPFSRRTAPNMFSDGIDNNFRRTELK